jgi:hypothetical protein
MLLLHILEHHGAFWVGYYQLCMLRIRMNPHKKNDIKVKTPKDNIKSRSSNFILFRPTKYSYKKQTDNIIRIGKSLFVISGLNPLCVYCILLLPPINFI